MEEAFPVFVSGDCEEDSADAGAGLVIGLCWLCGLYILSGLDGRPPWHGATERRLSYLVDMYTYL